MKTVSKDSVIDFYVWLDDHLVEKPKTRRPAALSTSELLTILLLSALTENHQRLSLNCLAHSSANRLSSGSSSWLTKHIAAAKRGCIRLICSCIELTSLR